MGKLSVVVITFNEEANIAACLKSAAWADELIVVDALSTDRTAEVARAHAHEVIRREWAGYSPQRNFGLERARNDWVLFLDADERLSPDLASEIKRALRAPRSPCDGYWIPRKTFYLGRWIEHGEWSPDLQLRLVRKGKARWIGKVHERVELDGWAGRLENFILHRSYRDLRHHWEKFERYSSLFAEEAFERGERARPRQLLLEPLARFLNGYFRRQGFRDGLPGLVIAAMQAWEVHRRYAKLRRLARGPR